MRFHVQKKRAIKIGQGGGEEFRVELGGSVELVGDLPTQELDLADVHHLRDVFRPEPSRFSDRLLALRRLGRVGEDHKYLRPDFDVDDASVKSVDKLLQGLDEHEAVELVQAFQAEGA